METIGHSQTTKYLLADTSVDARYGGAGWWVRRESASVSNHMAGRIIQIRTGHLEIRKCKPAEKQTNPLLVRRNQSLGFREYQLRSNGVLRLLSSNVL